MGRSWELFSHIFLRRTLFLYALGMLVLAFSVDYNRARLVHLDNVKPIEGYFEKFSENKISYDRQRFQDGVRYFQKVLEILPSFEALAYSHLGFCYFYLGDVSQAVAMYQKAIEMKPYLYTLPYDMALISLRRGDYRNALKFITGSAALLDSNEQYFLELSRQFQQMGKPDLALLSQKSLKKLKDDKKNFPYFFGVIHYHLKDFAAAVSFLNTAIKNIPDFPQAYYYRGQSYNELKQPAQSRIDLLKASYLKNQAENSGRIKEEIFRLHFNPMVVNFLP